MPHHEPESRTGRRLETSARALALLALLLAGSACRSVATPRAPLSESAIRLELPLVHQDALYDCGLASISALCQYWGVQIPDAERADLARSAQEQAGLSGSELQTALEQLGFEVYLFAGSLDRTATGIFANIDAGRPLLVMLSSNGTAHHYGLVLGYDEPHGNLILLDPLKGELLVPQPVFERDWARCQRFTLLATRKAPAPAPSETAQAP
jgi:ABC-type bacteriocin/lantibiotic exporter with double-glycine peptidase domain